MLGQQLTSGAGGGGEVAGLQGVEGGLGGAEEGGPLRRACPLHLVEVDRLLNVDDAGPDDAAGEEVVAELLARGARDEETTAEVFRQPLDAAGEVDGVAQRAVLELEARAGVADLGRTAI